MVVEICNSRVMVKDAKVDVVAGAENIHHGKLGVTT